MGETTSEMKSCAGSVIVGLYGAGGFAREVMPVLRAQMAILNGSAGWTNYEIVFVETEPSSEVVNGHRVLSEKEFFGQRNAERFFNVAIGDSRARERIARECLSNDAKPFEIRSPQATIYDENSIGDGAILCAHTTITSNAQIGRFFHANIYSYVAHDCAIGDYVTFAPGVHCNGNVQIHDHAYIGTGAVLKQGTRSRPLVIGEGAIVGMGAIVTRDVPPYTTVVGNPARELTRSKSE